MTPGPSLDTIRKDLEKERRALYEEAAQIQESIDRVEQSLVGLTGQHTLPPVPSSPVLDKLRDHGKALATATEPDRVRKSIGDDKLQIVKDYLANQPGRQARQADIDKATGLNNGTVSVALHVLLEQAEVEKLGKVNRSRMWRLRRAPRTA